MEIILESLTRPDNSYGSTLKHYGCRICKDGCLQLLGVCFEKEAWIQHWKQEHPFELSVLINRDS